MNIFALDNDPVQAARDQCNKHVVKMILESAQLLCTALYLRGAPTESLPYRPTHVRHPSTLWTAASPDNVAWLWLHALELCDEYERRYGKRHKTGSALVQLQSLVPDGDWRSHTPFAQAMPEEWKGPDAVTAYRCYYIVEKSRFARWAPRARPPAWWPFVENV